MKVFISYAFADRDIMNILKLVLEKYDIEAYAAEHDKKFGSSISNRIQDAIDESDVLIAIVTKSHASESVHQEIGYAIKKGTKVIPFVEEGANTGFMIDGLEQKRFVRDGVYEASKEVAEFLLSSKPRSTTKKKAVDEDLQTDDEELEEGPEIDETRIVDGEDYALYEFELERDDVMHVEVVSQEPVDILILNDRNLEKFEEGDDYEEEISSENVKRTKLVFENPRRGGWNVIVDNQNRKKTEITVKIWFEE